MKPEKKARQTIYKGIEMRSRLEAGYAAWLDRRGWTWSYEPSAFGSQEGQYLPDFRVEDVRLLLGSYDLCQPAYIEVKPSYAGLDLEHLSRRMAVIWDSEPDAFLVIQAPQPPMHYAPGPLGLAAERGVLHNTSHLLFLLRNYNPGVPAFATLTWLETRPNPAIGWPLTNATGPWAGDYWNVPKGA